MTTTVILISSGKTKTLEEINADFVFDDEEESFLRYLNFSSIASQVEK